MQQAHAVDDVIGTLDGGIDGSAVAQIAWTKAFGRTITARLEMERRRSGRRNPPRDAIAAHWPRPDHMPPDEAGSAEDGDELGLCDECHRSVLPGWRVRLR